MFAANPEYAPSTGPAGLVLTRQFARYATVLRLSAALVAGLVAVVGTGPPARPGWVVTALAAVLVWSCLLAHVLARRGLRAWVFVADTALVCVLCLAHTRLVPGDVLAVSAGTGWVDVLATTAVFMAQVGLRQPHGLLCGLAVTAAYVTGLPEAREAPLVLATQALLAALLVVWLRRAARASDQVQATVAAARAAQRAQAAARGDELDQQRRLHDTVLATLTMVGTGSVHADSASLRQRAAADLDVLDSLHPPDTSTATTLPGAEPAAGTALDTALHAAVHTPRPGLPALTVRFEVPPLQLPPRVVRALTDSAAEALTNIARHAGTTIAELAAYRTGDGVTVEVRDAGHGFHPHDVPAHRRGLRESIQGRMRAAGGRAEIATRRGTGTVVLLSWRP